MFNETYSNLKSTKTEIDPMRCLNVYDLNITSVIRLHILAYLSNKV